MNIRREHHEEREQSEGAQVRGVLDGEDRVGVQPEQGHPEPTAVPDDTRRNGGAGRAGLLNDVAGLRDEWQRVQGTFVDDPSRAVHEASVLVDRTLDEIRANVGSGHTSETMSTEDLRVSFQRYREFFQRLLSA
jgi:hypothetical protein